jgi:transposase
MAWRRGQTYSQDLRDRVLAGDDESAREVAERLDVSVSYVVKARQRRDRDGRVTAGPVSFARRRLLAEHDDAIRQRVRERADGTLEDLRAWLARSVGISVSTGTMWNTVRRLGLTLKKDHRGERTGARRYRRGAPALGRVAGQARCSPADLP